MIDFLYTDKKYLYYACRLTKNLHDAEDIIQDVALSLCRYLDRGESELKKMTYMSIKNLWISRSYRMSKKLKKILAPCELLDCNILTPSFENQFIAKETLRELYIKILMLPQERQENLLVLSGSKTYKEVSQRRGMSINTLLTHVNKDRQFLKGERKSPFKYKTKKAA